MRPQRMSLCILALACATAAAPAPAQESYTIQPLKEDAPKQIAAAVRATLRAEGYTITDAQGKTYAEIWLRQTIPASEKPGAAKGQILFPFLAEGELLGALRFTGEGHDYRDQTLPKGVYTLRYGRQPVNRDHLGVSPHRDFLLLLPASKDTEPSNLKKKPLEERSAESAGASHPAVLMLEIPQNVTGTLPAMSHDVDKNTWGAIMRFPLKVKASNEPASVDVQLILIGVAPI